MTAMATLTIPWTTHPPDEFTGGAVTVGNFDGVHLGHRALLAAVRRHARAAGGPAVAVTFDPPPVALLNPVALQAPLTTVADRADWLHAAGADHVVVLTTDPGLLALCPEAFFEDVVVRLFRARAVVEGFNFRFGRGRAGDAAALRQLSAAHGLTFEEVHPHLGDGEPVSSSRIRAALTAGDVTAAAQMLGRPYAVAGVVQAGAKRGRTLGFPTANVGRIPTLIPKDGVYAVTATADGRTFRGAANVGPAPTFGVVAATLEVHLIDFDGDLYGTELRVAFVRRLRDTRAFPGVAELVEQLRRDVAAARD